MVEAHAIGRNSGCRLLIGFEHRRGPAAIEDAAIWRLVDDRLDVEDLAAAFAIQMQLDLADGVAVRCRNIFQKGSIFGGAAGVVNLPRPAQFDLALDHRPDWRDTDSARDENRMRRAFLERKIVRRDRKSTRLNSSH